MPLMRRRDVLAALAVVSTWPAIGRFAPAASAPPTAADQPDLTRLLDYLNSIRSLRARFEQLAPDGSTSRGTVWLERPGRIRFQYDPPSPLLLIASHGEVYFHDSQLNQTSTIALSRTPLSILLADRITFSGPVTVTDLQKLPNEFQVSLVRSANPSEGLLALVFTDNPLALYQWTVVDPQHKITRVTLFNIQLGGHFDDNLFSFAAPAAR